MVVHFWAEWNAYDPVLDETMAPIREDLEARVFFCSCDVTPEENWELCRACGVMNLPWLCFFMNGELRGFHCGCVGADLIRAKLEGLLREVTTPAPDS